MTTVGIQIAATFDISPLQPILRNYANKYGFADDVKPTPPSELGRYMMIAPSDSESVIGTIVVARLEDWLRNSTRQGLTIDDMTARRILRTCLDEFSSQLAVLALRGRPVWLLICPSTGWVAERLKVTTLCRTMTNLLAARTRNLSQITVLNWPTSLLSEDFNDRDSDQVSHTPYTAPAWEQLGESIASQISNWLANENRDAALTGTQGSAELAAFLEGLRVSIELTPAQSADLPHADRIIRTAASFTLTGEKPTIAEREVEAIVNSGNCYLVHVADRLSDYGHSGVIVARPVDGALVVNLLSLSCTVLGKQVEHAVLTGLAQVASSQGLGNVVFEYRPSGRNQPTLSFLKMITAGDNENRFQVATADVEESIRRAAVAPGAWSLKVSNCSH